MRSHVQWEIKNGHSNLRASAKNYGGCGAKSEADFHFQRHVSLIVSVRVVLGRSVVGNV